MEADPWDEYAGTWDDDPAARAYATATFASFQDVLAQRDLDLVGAAVCDFGSGTGLLTERLADLAAQIDAVDTSSAMLAVLDAKVEAHGWTAVRTSTALPNSQASHDLIVCSSVCSFLPDYPGTVSTLVALLRPGGLFVQWDWEAEPGSDDHGLSRDEITSALGAADLIDVRVDTAFEIAFEGETIRPLIGVGQKR